MNQYSSNDQSIAYRTNDCHYHASDEVYKVDSFIPIAYDCNL